jgi:hypothetical protein
MSSMKHSKLSKSHNNKQTKANRWQVQHTLRYYKAHTEEYVCGWEERNHHCS